MIATDHFVYIHTSRHAGTFLNKLILEHIPGAHMLRYHGHLSDLPEQYQHLPVIGLVRNPWDWYVSMYHDYRRKQQYIFQIITDNGALDFDATVRRFLQLGEDTPESNGIRQTIIQYAPEAITVPTPANRQMPGLTKIDFQNYKVDQGYYSWLYRLMFHSDNQPQIHVGRFENLREEMLRLLQLTGTEITPQIEAYLKTQQAVNSSPRNTGYREYFSDELRALVDEKDAYINEKYDYIY